MKKILLVEDNETIVMGLKYSLEQENFQVISALNVEKAKDILNQETIDLILLDVTLPDGNGFELCKYIKQKLDVPVIFLTAQDEETSVVIGLDMGADDYIVKPFRIGITNIFNTITTNMNLRKKEFAMLKSVGMTKKEFNRMIRLESIFYGLKSLIIGIPIGTLLSYAIYKGFETNMGMAYVLGMIIFKRWQIYCHLLFYMIKFNG